MQLYGQLYPLYAALRLVFMFLNFKLTQYSMQLRRCVLCVFIHFTKTPRSTQLHGWDSCAVVYFTKTLLPISTQLYDWFWVALSILQRLYATPLCCVWSCAFSWILQEHFATQLYCCSCVFSYMLRWLWATIRLVSRVCAYFRTALVNYCWVCVVVLRCLCVALLLGPVRCHSVYEVSTEL